MYIVPLKDAGFVSGNSESGGDYTDKLYMQIPMPKLAIVNITSPNGIANWPQAKGSIVNYYMEFYDNNGNYFKKEIIFDAQGSSSMAHAKKKWKSRLL